MSTKHKSVAKGKPVNMAPRKAAPQAVAPEVEEQSEISVDELVEEMQEEEQDEETDEAAESEVAPASAEMVAQLEKLGFKIKAPRAKKRYQTYLVKTNENYFPAEGSKLRAELEKIVKAGAKGLDANQFGGVMPQLSQLTVNGLVDCTGGRLFATQRCRDIIVGKITLENPRGETDGFWSTIRKASIARKTMPEVAELLSQLRELVEDVELPKKAKGEDSAA